MLSFPFTRKKFLSLTHQGRHRWVIKWLSTVYQKISSNRVGPENLGLFAGEYTRVMEWCKTLPQNLPEPNDRRGWLEFISDAIHCERSAAGIVPKDQDLLAAIETEDSQEEKSEFPRLDFHMALDGLRSLFNVGSIFRTCDAAGFSSLILGNTPGGEHSLVQKTSMGAASWMPHTKTRDLAHTLITMKAQGYRITAVETAKQSRPYNDNPWPGRGVVVMGNEEYGISSHVMRVCDEVVHIPMFGRKNSLNVANAAAVVLFHIASTRYAQGPQPV
ncbi:MAG: RNA methyltransferase [Desulfobacterium sp.]|nr:RNA methyltransferase [Desulfobacterium sp.]